MAQIETFVQRAWEHLRADRPKQSMDFAKKALSINPNSPDVLHLLGVLASRDGKPDVALPLLQKAIDTGGKTSQRLQHIAEALFTAGYPDAAMVPLNDALTEFGESSNLLGLKSAIEIGMEKWDTAVETAKNAIKLNPNLLAWDLNLSIAQLMKGNWEEGFKYATARLDNLKIGGLCPALMHSKPCALWIKGEQGVGDSLFFLRFIIPLVKKGWQFHLEVDRKLVPLLVNSQLFLSVKEKNKCPKDEICLNIGDLPLMALQCGIKELPPPFPLEPNTRLVEKYKQELAKFGPPPYVAVSWRGGPKGLKHKAGIRSLEKIIDPSLLGEKLANIDATIINIQRLPIMDEAMAFQKALGRKSADYTALNNNLEAMLAVLSLVDEYVTISNTNLHLREGLCKTSKVFVNHPYQDWRWQCSGNHSVWYPNSQVFRQQKDKSWGDAFVQLTNFISNIALSQNNNTTTTDKSELSKSKTTSKLLDCAAESEKKELDDAHLAIINEGWAIVAKNIPEAIAKARTVLSQDPQNARALHLLGWAAVQDLKFDLGLSLLAQAVQLEPNNGNIWRDYIRMHVIQDNCDEAINIAKQCLNNSKLWAKGVVYYALGIAYISLDKDKAALDAFEQCSTLIQDHIDAPAAAGLLRLRMGDGYAAMGFKLNTARTDVRKPEYFPYWVCPTLKGDVAGLNVLIVRSLGFGDELSYLRYLPYLINAGVKVTYWCGFKLVPLLKRLPYQLTIISDTEPMPDPANYDLAFIKNELPIAVEHLGAPEIADSLPLIVDEVKLEKWRNWLKDQADGPYIGISWSAGVSGTVKDGFGYSRLSKKVEPSDLAKSLSGINATWVSLTRNISKEEINAFEQYLGSSVIDVAGLTDDLDDLLCIQYLLAENVGVSNTNTHLRACLGLGSRVLVSLSSRDWRWGVEGDHSTWFKDCVVYRENKTDGWQSSLAKLRNDLIQQYGMGETQQKRITQNQVTAPIVAKKIIWVTAGEIKKGDEGYYSHLSSAQERVVNVAKLLETKGWNSVFLIESVSELMGGWHDKVPVKGDIVVFSKVFTDHSISLMQDAKARGATVVFDVFNDFADLTKRGIHQRKLMETADLVLSCPKLQSKWEHSNQPIAFYFENIDNKSTEDEQAKILENWLQILESEEANLQAYITNIKNKKVNPEAEVAQVKQAITPTKRLIWLSAGEIKTDNDKQTSELASARYRVISPSQALAKLGWKSEMVNESTATIKSGWGDTPPQAGDTVIVSKVFTQHAIIMAKDAKSRGARVFVDMCDNFLTHPKYGVLQKELLACADNVVTSTPSLKEALVEIGKHADAVISDPVEFNRGEIKFSPGTVLNLLWFGHPVNIDTLAECLPAISQLAKTIPLQIQVVTSLPNGQQDLDTIVPTGLKASYTQWSTSATEEAIARCDIVIIPTVQNDFKNAKSPNRLLEPLWAGRIVVAGPLPAYLHFADSAWVGKDLTEGIKWCLANPEQVKTRISQGQADIEKYFTAQAIGLKWHDVLSKTDTINVVNDVPVNTGSTKAKSKIGLKEVAILTTQQPTLPSIAIRLIEPLAALDEYSVKLASGIQNQKLVIDFETLLMRDIIVVQRDFPSTDTLPLLKKLKVLGKKLVYETDDAFHLIPETHSKAFHRAKAPAIFEFAKLADVITVSTEALANEFKPYGKVTIVPNLLSPNLWNESLLKQQTQKRKVLSPNIRIGLIGGANHRDDFLIVKEAIQTIASLHPTITWVAYGESAVSLFNQIPECSSFENHPTNYQYPSHPKRMADLALDISLVPLLDDAFNKCISNLKYLELGFLAVACVFSNTQSYNTTVLDGETGLLVNNNTDSWAKAIQQLIEDQKLREKLGSKAQQEVQKNWIINSQNNGWKELLEKLV